MRKIPSLLLTFDVEDWFQVENFRQWHPIQTWDQQRLRVESNIHRLLDMLDELSSERCARSDTSCRESSDVRQPKVSATFFILGWLAERLPSMVREIQQRGHEVASHGYGHDICYQLTPGNLSEDLCQSRKILEDITGGRVDGYRAPNFSITDDIVLNIAKAGYRYDSSYNSFSMHGRYGRCSVCAGNSGYNHIDLKLSDELYELPISNLSFNHGSSKLKTSQKWMIPWGGGAYFRIIPLALFQAGIRHILEQQGAYVFYLHPWEIDPEQPREKRSSLVTRFRHYYNLSGTEEKFMALFKNFTQCHFLSCKAFLELTDE